MKKIIVIMFIGTVLLATAGEVSASMRGICRGYGTGRVHVHVHSGSRYRGGGDDLIFLLMISSTSTSIYCISIADEEEDWRRSRRQRYSLINYERLKEEGARGRGEYLAALSYTMGCDSTVRGEFASSIQKTYGSLFKPSGEFRVKGFMDRLEEMISENPKLRSGCTKRPPDAKKL